MANQQQPPCQPCQRSRAECIFSNRSNPGTPGPGAGDLSLSDILSTPVQGIQTSQQPATALPSPAAILYPDEHHQHHLGPPILPSPFRVPVADGPVGDEQQWDASAAAPPMDAVLRAQSPRTQISRSLEDMPGYWYQLGGASCDADPWLLRHCQFDDFGFRRFFRIHFQNAGGVPTPQLIPVQFIVTEKHEPNVKAEADRSRALWDDLARLVPVPRGQRLLQL